MRIFSRVIPGLLFGSIVSVTGEAIAFDPNPLFSTAASYSPTTLPGGDPTDIYYPVPFDSSTGNYSFPVALLLQGTNVDKANYSEYASIVARYGFIVVVSNNFQSIPPIFTGLLPDTSQITDTLALATIENTNLASPIAGKIDTGKLALLGHSGGGAVGLSAIAGLCIPFLCNSGSFVRPDALKAGIFFGANLRNQTTNQFIPIPNQGIATALLQGDRDSRALPSRAFSTYQQIQSPPKAYITVLGANHYGITNTNNPAGAIPDSLSPTLDRVVGIETLGRWTGLFLRSSLLNDGGATDYIYRSGDALDPNVSVLSEPIPEPNLTISLLFLGGSAAIVRFRRRYSR